MKKKRIFKSSDGVNNLVDLVHGFLRNISGKLKFSISYKISVTYFKLLFSSTFLILLITMGIYLVATIWGIKQEQDIIFHEINNNLTPTTLVSGDWIEKYPSYNVIIYNDKKQMIYSDYEWPIQADGPYYYVEDNVHYFGRQNKVILGEQTYYVKLLKNISTPMKRLALLLISIFIVEIIRNTHIIRKGAKLNKQVLKPIQDMTATTQAISEYNLNLRINVEGAKYELKDLAKTINHMLERIETAYYKQQQFVSDASHELRTPISVIKGYANLLSRWGKEDKEVLDESIAALQNESDNMQDLVEKLLFLARHDKQTHKMNMEAIHIQGILKELVKETTMIQNKHEIIDDIQDDAIILLDKNSIKQVIRIFMDNAVKYTPDGGTITVKGKLEADTYMIAISDTGMGISKDELKRVFDRFYRTDDSRHKIKSGHGLGLAIAKLIVSAHGGKIKVRSRVGEGSEFRIYLKCKRVES